MSEGKSGVCRIVGAGDFDPAVFETEAGDLVIAADRGYALLREAGIPCDLYIGDSDSLGFSPEGVRSIVLPKVKDDTDTLAAVREGLNLGYRRFVLYGAMGGNRFSHTVANLSTLLTLSSKGAKGQIRDLKCRIDLVEQGEEISLAPCRYFSLFSATEKAIVSVSGAKYNLSHAPLTIDFPLGVSNEIAGETRVQVHQGKVFLILDL